MEIGYDPVSRSFKKEFDRTKHFSEHHYGKLEERHSFRDTMQTLKELSGKLSTTSVKQVAEDVFQLLCKYFWNFKMQVNNAAEIDKVMEDRVLSFFNSDLTYPEFYREYQYKVSKFRRFNENRDGLTLSTFHSLKGLEFKNVIVICMDNEIFPNFSRIDASPYDEDAKQRLKESETRLWYVAMTRAIDSLTLYYNKNNPSYYVQCALDDNFPMIRTEESIDTVQQLSESSVQYVSHDLENNFLAGSLQDVSGNRNWMPADDSEFADDVEEIMEDVHVSDSEVSDTENPRGPVVTGQPQQEGGIQVTLQSGRGVYLNRLLQNLCTR